MSDAAGFQLDPDKHDHVGTSDDGAYGFFKNRDTGLVGALPLAGLDAGTQQAYGLSGGPTDAGAGPDAGPAPGDSGGSSLPLPGPGPTDGGAPTGVPSGGYAPAASTPPSPSTPVGGPPIAPSPVQRIPIASLAPAPAAASPAAALPPKTTPGGAPGYDPLKGFDQASQDQAFDLSQQAKAADVQAQAGAKGAAEIADKRQAAADLALQREAAVNAEYAKGMQEVQAQQRALGATKEDPEHWFHSRSVGGKLAAVLSLSLGAVQQSLTGQNSSPVMEFIRQDIDAQRNNFARAKDSLEAKRSDYTALRSAGMNDATASLALKDKMYDAAKDKLAAMVTKSSPQAAQLAAKVQIDALNKSQVDDKVKLQNEVATTSHEKAATAEVYQNIAASRQQQAYAQQSRQMLANGQVPPELRGQAVYDPTGQKLLGIAPSAEEGASHRQMVGDSAALLKEIDEAKSLAQKWGSSSNKTEAGAAYKAKLDAIIGKLNSAQGIKQAVEEGQRKLYTDTFGNETTTPTSATLAGLDGLAQSLKTNVNSRLRSSGPGMQLAYPEAGGNSAQQKALDAAGIK